MTIPGFQWRVLGVFFLLPSTFFGCATVDTDINRDEDASSGNTDTGSGTIGDTDTDTSSATVTGIDTTTVTATDTIDDTATETYTDSRTNSDTDTETGPDAGTGTNTDTRTGAGDTDADTDSSPDGDTDTDTDSSPDGDTDTDVDTDSDTVPDAGRDTDDAGVDTDDTGTGTDDTDTGTESGSHGDTGTGSGTDVDTPDLSVLYWHENYDTPSNEWYRMLILIYNNGIDNVPLEGIVLRYYYTIDGAIGPDDEEVFYCWENCASVTGTFHDASGTETNRYLELNLSEEMTILASNGAWSIYFGLRVDTNTSPLPYLFANDWSHSDMNTLTENNRITLHTNGGALIWGEEPF